MLNWDIETTDKYENRFKHYEKKNPKVLEAVLNNLDTYQKALALHGNPQKINAGFIHTEPHGVKAIDQKGSKGRLKEARLYIYPDVTKGILYLITIGDKNTQSEDIKFCRNFVKIIRKDKNGQNL